MARRCTRCVYDDKTPNISFDSDGVCNYCKQHDQFEADYPTGEAGRKKLEELAARVKRDGKGKEFDCVIGVSGGCDSSYLCWLAKDLGLRPVAAHFDNTWNSKIAVENIHRVLDKLDIPLYTYVMDNEEFNDLQRSFLKASVLEIDALTDIALTTTLYMAAEKYGVKHIFNGHSFRTEGVAPVGWVYADGKYIESIQKRYGTMRMKRFPNLWLSRWMKWLLMGIERHRPLYYVDYNKGDVKKFLEKELDWQWYGGHHMENRYTSFANRYYIPEKFKIDFRYIEFSALVRSGQMGREAALAELSKKPSYDKETIIEIKKRLRLTDEDFDEIMHAPLKSYRDYETYLPTFKLMRPFFWLMYKMGRVPKSFYVKYTQ